MTIIDIIAALIAAFLGAATPVPEPTNDEPILIIVDDTEAPWAIPDIVTPDPPCAGEGCGDRAIDADGPAFVEETADRTGNPYHLPDECADGSIECICTPEDGCRAVGPPPVPNATGPDWSGYEYLLDPGPDFLPLTDDDGTCSPMPDGSIFPGSTSWTFQPCDPDTGMLILNPCRPVDPATTWECVHAYTGETGSLKPQEL